MVAEQEDVDDDLWWYHRHGDSANYTDYAQDADYSRSRFIEQGDGDAHKVIKCMLKVVRLRTLMLAHQQLPAEARSDLPMDLGDWAQSENQQSIDYIETEKLPVGAPDVNGLVAHFVETKFRVDYDAYDDNEGYSKYDDPMQEYYDEGYGSG